MPNREGTPIWYELLSDDPNAAQAFYADVVGWDIAPGETGYRIVTAPDGERIAGLMKQPDGMKNGPTWLGISA